MDKDIKNAIEIEIRKIFDQEDLTLSRQMADQIEYHRKFLQTQFKFLTWGVGILFVFATGAFAFLFGKSYDSIKDKIIQEVDQKVIEYRIVDDFKKRLDEQLRLAVENPQLTEEIYSILSKKITQHVSNVASNQVVERTNKIITQRLSDEIEKISKESLNQLVERAAKDALIEINQAIKKIADIDVNDIIKLKAAQMKTVDVLLHYIGRLQFYEKNMDQQMELHQMSFELGRIKQGFNK